MAGAGSFEVSIKSRDGGCLITLSGELDMETAQRVQEAFVDLQIDHSGALVLDLRGLTFIDSTGLRVLLEAREWAAGRGCRFALVRGPDVVQRVFEIVKLDSVLTFVDDPADVE
jgi:anti-anti-sigma factor